MRRALLIASLLVPTWHHVASACDDDDNDSTEAAEPEEPDEPAEAETPEEPEQPGDNALEARVEQLEERVATLEQERGSTDTCESGGDSDDRLDVDVDIEID